MVGIAIAARFYFLDAYCPGCLHFKQIDLPNLHGPERPTLYALIPFLSCQNGRPSPPFRSACQVLTVRMGKRQSALYPSDAQNLKHRGDDMRLVSNQTEEDLRRKETAERLESPRVPCPRI